MIPKVVHYCWFGRHEMPPLNRACMDTWEILQDYEIKRWDEDDIPDNTFLKEQLSKKNWAFVSDYIRLYVLYTEGGIYLDTDFEVIRSMDELLEFNLFLCEESTGRINNAAMGSIKGHAFLRECMDYIEIRHEKGYVYHISPIVTTYVYNKGDFKDIEILPPDYFYPYNPYDDDKQVKQLLVSMVTENTFAIHHWAKSWGLLQRLSSSKIGAPIAVAIKKVLEWVGLS